MNARPSGIEVVTEGSVISIYVGGTEQTRIDLSKPSRLEFEYMQQMTAVLQGAFPEPAPIRAVHIGGGGCALPWAWELRRPGSKQLAIEADPWIAENARVWFPLPRKPNLRIRQAEGRQALSSSQGRFQVVVRDAFLNAQVPHHLTTSEWVRIVREHLSDQGLYLANTAHGSGSSCRPEVAAVTQTFQHTLVIAESKVLKGARWGNATIVAWDDLGTLNPAEIDRQMRRLPLPVSVLTGEKLRRWLGGTRPAVDNETGASNV